MHSTSDRTERSDPTDPPVLASAAGSRRASPLPPEERRRSLIEATLPLLREHGERVTTSQIATAAGVAEGTIFGVFESKEELVAAAVEHAMDPAPAIAAIAAIPADLPLEARVERAADVLADRLRSIFGLLGAIGMRRPPGERPGGFGPTRHAPILGAIANLLEPDRDRMHKTPDEVAHLLRLVTFSNANPMINDGVMLSSAELGATLLHGVVAPTRSEDPPC